MIETNIDDELKSINIKLVHIRSILSILNMRIDLLEETLKKILEIKDG